MPPRLCVLPPHKSVLSPSFLALRGIKHTTASTFHKSRASSVPQDTNTIFNNPATCGVLYIPQETPSNSTCTSFDGRRRCPAERRRSTWRATGLARGAPGAASAGRTGYCCRWCRRDCPSLKIFCFGFCCYCYCCCWCCYYFEGCWNFVHFVVDCYYYCCGGDKRCMLSSSRRHLRACWRAKWYGDSGSSGLLAPIRKCRSASEIWRPFCIFYLAQGQNCCWFRLYCQKN